MGRITYASQNSAGPILVHSAHLSRHLHKKDQAQLNRIVSIVAGQERTRTKAVTV